MTSEAWFAVLPDGESGGTAARALRRGTTEVIDHHSGRPWLVGSWPAGQVVVAAVGGARLAVIGRCPVTTDALASRLRRVRDVADVEGALAGLEGSFHAVASVGGRVRVRGSASAVRRVFRARVDGVTVAASRADVLARAVGAGVDERRVALHLLSSPPPYPLDAGPGLWRGVEALPAGSFLLLEADGRAEVHRWWNPPEPQLSLAEGAVEVGRALTAAVDSCTADAKTVSSDLSGGMDSTSLCFLAARGQARLVTFRWESVDAANDDAAWAGLAAARLPGSAEHVVPERSRAPLWFSGLADLEAAADEPGSWVRDGARLATLVGLMTEHGSQLHLSGGGGDELFCAFPSYVHDSLRSHPLPTLGLVRRQRLLQRWSLWPLLRGLADRSTFSQWLAAWADGLTGTRRPSPARTSTAWGADLRMPPWASPDAVRSVQSLLRAAAADLPEPLAAQRGQHAALSCVQMCGRGFRQVDQVTSAQGLPYAAPYLDDRVIEAALSVRVAERSARDRYKPVLATAMSGIVPDTVLARSTKGEYSADFHLGLRRNKAALAEIVAESRLARAGLLDAAALRASLRRPELSPDLMRSLDNTLACEMWLRSALGAGGPGPEAVVG
ncbi:asparagine synthase-related protein [Streptomyces olivoreticuli]|uniref:asparagine synthase-related protein n=1 Tax=Streptomyces olivoreticuli TaxID=68246 RepID=UPI000E23D894|nr:asparagine synthase-related protein [Streptomyces olivoreticuli]